MVKGHAYGNDFLLAPEADVEGRDCAALARAACSRHEGIGADGLMIYTFEPSSVRMRLFNADGSQSEVSGNGVRCLAALAVRERPGATSVTIDTPAGPKVLHLQHRDGDTADVSRCDGDADRISGPSNSTQPVSASRRCRCWLEIRNVCCSRMSCSNARLHALGPAIEHHRNFPIARTSSFAKVEAPDRVRILIWERGVGPTQASGTGACGAAVAAASYGGAARDVEIISPGGSQRVEWLEDGLYLTGWAKLVFEGKWLG